MDVSPSVCKDKFIEVSFLLKNRDVVSKRFYKDLEINEVIPYALEGLGLSPLEITSVGVECVTVTKSKLQFSQDYVDNIIKQRIISSVESMVG